MTRRSWLVALACLGVALPQPLAAAEACPEPSLEIAAARALNDGDALAALAWSQAALVARPLSLPAWQVARRAAASGAGAQAELGRDRAWAAVHWAGAWALLLCGGWSLFRALRRRAAGLVVPLTCAAVLAAVWGAAWVQARQSDRALVAAAATMRALPQSDAATVGPAPAAGIVVDIAARHGGWRLLADGGWLPAQALHEMDAIRRDCTRD